MFLYISVRQMSHLLIVMIFVGIFSHCFEMFNIVLFLYLIVAALVDLPEIGTPFLSFHVLCPLIEVFLFSMHEKFTIATVCPFLTSVIVSCHYPLRWSKNCVFVCHIPVRMSLCPPLCTSSQFNRWSFRLFSFLSLIPDIHSWMKPATRSRFSHNSKYQMLRQIELSNYSARVNPYTSLAFPHNDLFLCPAIYRLRAEGLDKKTCRRRLSLESLL